MSTSTPDARTLARAERWLAEPSGLPYEPFLASGSDVHRAADVFRRLGSVVLGPPVLDRGLFDDLVADSRRQRSSAAWDLRGEPGALPQDTVRAHLGPLARQLCAAGATRALMQAVTGDAVLPSWSASCLTYYDTPGQFLGAHRDKLEACHHAFLLYLESSWPAGLEPGPGVALHICAPDSDEVTRRVTALPNRLVILHGSRLTHFRPPLAVGEMVGLLAGCFALLDPAPARR